MFCGWLSVGNNELRQYNNGELKIALCVGINSYKEGYKIESGKKIWFTTPEAEKLWNNHLDYSHKLGADYVWKESY